MAPKNQTPTEKVSIKMLDRQDIGCSLAASAKSPLKAERETAPSELAGLFAFQRWAVQSDEESASRSHLNVDLPGIRPARTL
jgi:hypothetical protein